METSDFAHEMSLDSGQQVIEKLASTGGTCDTYRVRINGKWHFMKRPKAEMAFNPLLITAFEREFDIGYRLEHQSLVRYIDKRSDEQGVYILTEMVDGDNLDEFISKNPDFFKDKRNLKEFVTQMLDVLDYLHNNQVLHLDLTPSNIMITRVGHKVKLVDLGFAYSDCYQTVAAGMTRDYAAPEQLDGGEVGPWTDIYSFGKVLLKLFNNGKSQDAVQSVPSYYRNFVKKCVERTPDQRFATVADALQYLSRKHLSHKLIAVILISAALLTLILWGIIHVRETEHPQSTTGNSTIAHNTIDSIANRKSKENIKVADDSLLTKKQLLPRDRPNQDNNTEIKSSSPSPAQTSSDLTVSVDKKSSLPPTSKIFTVPEALKSQLHAKSKAAFAALERKYTVVDNYKTRGDLMAEIKNARLEILEYAKSQAKDNEGKEKYYNAALEIVNEEYEHSNLPEKLTQLQR